MAKRFSENEIWKKQRWFRKLSPEYKLAFFYIKDQCDHAGIWNIDCSDLLEDTGLVKFDINSFISVINTDYDKITGDIILKERVLVIRNKKMWVTGFVQFQYEGRDKLVRSSNAVRSALMILDGIILQKNEPFGTLPNPSEPFTTLEYALDHLHIKLNEPLGTVRKGWATLMDKDRDKDRDNIVKQEKTKNEKFSGNFKAQGEELFAARMERHKNKRNQQN